jgi:hypothetical protein
MAADVGIEYPNERAGSAGLFCFCISSQPSPDHFRRAPICDCDRAFQCSTYRNAKITLGSIQTQCCGRTFYSPSATAATVNEIRNLQHNSGAARLSSVGIASFAATIKLVWWKEPDTW